MQKLEKSEFLSLLETQPYLVESVYGFDFCQDEQPMVTHAFTFLGESTLFAANALNQTTDQTVDPDSDDLYAALNRVRKPQEEPTVSYATPKDVYDALSCKTECYTGTILELQQVLKSSTALGDIVLRPTFLVVPENSATKQYHIQQQLLQYKTQLTEQGYQVIGLFLYGSQNYQMDTLQSDIDAVAVIIPTVDDFAWQKATEKTLHTETGDIRIKDVRRFAAQLLKGNYSSLEWLLTPYKVVDANYFTDLLQPQMVENLLNFSPVRTLASTFGSIMNVRLHASANKSDGANAARLAHLLRFNSYVLKQLETKDRLSLEDWRYAFSGNPYFGCDKRTTTDLEILQLQTLKGTDLLEKEALTDLYCTLEEQDVACRKQYTQRYPDHADQTWDAKQQQIAHQLAKWVTKVCMLFVFEQHTKAEMVDQLLPE